MAFTGMSKRKTAIEQIRESAETMKFLAESILDDMKSISPTRTQAQDFRLECALRALAQLKGDGDAVTPWGWARQSGELVLNPLAGLMWGFATVYSSLTDEKNSQYYKNTPVRISMLHDNGVSVAIIDHDMQVPTVLWHSRHDTLTDLAELPEFEATIGLTAEELKDIQNNFGDKKTGKIPYLEMANRLREKLIPNIKPFTEYKPYVPPVHVPYQAKVETVGTVAPTGDAQTAHPALADLPSATQAKVEEIRAGLEALEEDELDDEVGEAVVGSHGLGRNLAGFYGCE